jgi:phage gp36-like protein
MQTGLSPSVFTVRGSRHRGSTQETKSVRALQVASLKLASVMESTDPLPTKPAVLREFSDRFLYWVNNSRLEEKTKKFYRDGWRLLKATSVAVCELTRLQVIAPSN